MQLGQFGQAQIQNTAQTWPKTSPYRPKSSPPATNPNDVVLSQSISTIHLIGSNGPDQLLQYPTHSHPRPIRSSQECLNNAVPLK